MFDNQLIWDESIYIFLKILIFCVILNKYNSPCNKKNDFYNKNDF